MARCSFFSDTFAAPRGASWPFFLAFPGFSSSSALFALHPSGFVTSHEQGFLFCTPFAHPISDELFNTLVAQFVGQWFAGHKQVTVPIGIILIVDAFRMTRLHRQGLTQVRDQLFAPLIHTDLWTTFIVGARVDLQDVFHMIHKVGIGLWWNAPVVLEPGLQFVFFNTCRTVSWLTLSTSSSSTSLSATRRKLQRSYPSGAWPHSSAIRCASCSPSSLRFSCRGGCGRRLSAASKPPCTKLRRTRCTVVSPTSRASWICRADQRGPSGPQSALSRIRAWVSLRAGACPALIKAARFRRCSCVKTMLFFFMEVSLSGLNSSFSFKDTSFVASGHMKLDRVVGADVSALGSIHDIPIKKLMCINRVLANTLEKKRCLK